MHNKNDLISRTYKYIILEHNTRHFWIGTMLQSQIVFADVTRLLHTLLYSKTSKGRQKRKDYELADDLGTLCVYCAFRIFASFEDYACTNNPILINSDCLSVFFPTFRILLVYIIHGICRELLCGEYSPGRIWT